MARGMAPRPPTGGGRPQPPRRTTPQRTQKTGQPKAGAPKAGQQKGAQQRSRQTDQQRLRMVEQQRRATVRINQQQRLRQNQFLREAHTARQQAEAERRSETVREQEARLESILSSGLRRSARIDLDSLRRRPVVSPFDPGPLAAPGPEPVWEQFAPAAPEFLSRLWGGQARRERQEAAAQEAFERARGQWREAERVREEKLAAAQRAHADRQAEHRAEAERYQARVARIAAGLRERDPKAVESFLRTVLRRVPLPPDFPRRTEVTYHSGEERVVVRVQVPDREVVPSITGYEYNAGVDEMRSVARTEKDAEGLYRRVLGQVALLVVRDVFEAETHLRQVDFHGHVDVTDEASRARDYPCLIRLTVDRDTFTPLDLGHTPPDEALRQLNAEISPDPYRHEPIPQPTP